MGSCHTSWGWNILKINTDGFVLLDIGKVIETEKSENYFLTNDQLLEIYKTVIVNIFFWTQKNYSNPIAVDGFCQNLKIIAEEKEHEIFVGNKNIKQVNNITGKIFDSLS
ncbi:MAG: hypothetical protein KJI70_02450 [Patescibacteria group bacterium]|nr:hypothetical protein [Patescibacteria group bacterium]